MDHTTPLSEENKTTIQESIVKAVVTSLEHNSLEENELPAIGDFVLSSMETVRTQDQMIAFLSQLSQRWHIFSQIEILEKGKVQSMEDKKSVEDVLTLAKEGRISEAVALAKSATEV